MGPETMMRALVTFAAVAVAYVIADGCTSDAGQIPAIAIRQELCPASAPFFGFMGCAAALVFACLGAAYGTAKSGVGVGIMGEAYGYASFSGYAGLSAGLCCGMAGLSAGIAIGIVGDAGVRANARQPKLFVGVILILIFAE